MSMSDPLLPVPPEFEQDLIELEDDEEPDVLTAAGDDGGGPTERDAGAFQPPEAGDRLSAAELEDDLG